jgi:hypothetical protein
VQVTEPRNHELKLLFTDVWIYTDCFALCADLLYFDVFENTDCDFGKGDDESATASDSESDQ